MRLSTIFRKLSLVMLICFGTTAIAQKSASEKVDSLQTSLSKEKKNDVKVEILCKMANLCQQYDFKKSVEYAEQAKEIALKNNYKELYTLVYHQLGTSYVVSNDQEKAIKYLQEPLKSAKYSKESKLIIRTYHSLARAYMAKADFPKALEFALAALREAEKQKNENSIAHICNLVGGIYLTIKKTDEAEKYLKRTISIFEKSGAEAELAGPISNLGQVFQNQKKYDLALEYYFKANEINKKIGDDSYMAINYLNIATCYGFDQLNKPEESLKYNESALALFRKLGDKESEISVMGNIGSGYMAQGDYKKGEKYCLSVIKEREITSINFVKEAYRNLYQMYKKTGNTDRALWAHENLTTLTDSIYNKENDEKLAEQKVQYEYDKKAEVDKVIFDQKIQKEKSFQKYLISGLFLLSGLLFFAYRAFRIKKKANETIAAQNNQLETYSKANENLIYSLSHDIKEPMLGLQFLLQRISIDDEYLQKATIAIGDQVASINGIVNNLLQLKKAAGKDEAEYMTKSEIMATIDKVSDTLNYKFKEKNITISNTLDNTLPSSLPISSYKLYQVVLNLLSNASKYSPENSRIEIYANTSGIFVRDYGTGIDPAIMSKIGRENIHKNDQNSGSGMGLVLMNNLLQGSKMKLHFENAYGQGAIAGLIVV